MHPRAARAWLAGLCAAVAAQASADDVSRHPAVDHLRQVEYQARRAGTARAEFQVTFVPTGEEAARVIRAVNQSRLQRPDRHLLGAAAARHASYRAVWLRKGNREREDRTYATGKKLSIVTPWGGEKEKPAYLVQPYSLAFEYRGRPLSDWIRQGLQREIARAAVDGREQTQVSVVARREGAPLVVLTFDDQQRLIARDVHVDQRNYLVEQSRLAPRLYTRHEFADFRTFDDGHGGAIAFPTRALLRYYAGETRAGEQVEKHAIEVTLEKLELGIEVPDEHFAAETPPEVLERVLEENPEY